MIQLVQRRAIGWTAGVQIPGMGKIFLFSIISKPPLGPTQPIRELFRRG
jgi:hypothetical protein